jgi:tRNA dimethylallyltransferase
MSTVHPIILILGPTAGGKTALAIELARRLPGGGECVCADSMQVYRGMDIGTAKPTAAERSRAPHHLLDVADPGDDTFNVDTWMRLAEATIEQIRARGTWPIVVGGTNLYIQALLWGLTDAPPPDPQLRARLAETSQEDLRKRLEAVDPQAASRLHPNDRRRTIRAIEVYERSGNQLSALQTQWEAPAPRDDVFVVGLTFTAEAINRRINARVGAMLEAGLVDEVVSLADALGRQAAAALGYAQILEHVAGACSLEEAVEQIKIRTRRFAKQQRTWLRRFSLVKPAVWIEAAGLDAQDVSDKALAAILDRSAPPA